MTTKQQLQTKIEELEIQLNEFKQLLNNFKEYPKIEDARVGDVLEDGSVVVFNYSYYGNRMVLLMAPKMTEVCCEWDEDFERAYYALDNFNLRSCDWFIPNIKHLTFAMKQVPHEFVTTYYYWTSEAGNEREAKAVKVSGLSGGSVTVFNKFNICKVRAFRFLKY